jgi:hypothetical protein
MKRTFYSATKFLLALGVLVFSSCQDEDTTPSAQLNETEETAQEVDLNASLEDIDEVALIGFQRNGFADRSLITLEEDLCSRVVITWLPGEKKMVIDFGEGCTSPRGVTRKGKIIVTYTGRYWSPGSKITTRFENYYVDGKKIEGIRVVTNEGFNEGDKFFTFKIVMEGGKITWPDGTFRTFEKRHTKRIFLPNGDRGVMYVITGGSKGKNREGKEFVVEIAKPLVYFERCIKSGIRVPSEGILHIQVQSKDKIIIDFGDKTCDKEVTITKNGDSKTVTLPRS